MSTRRDASEIDAIIELGAVEVVFVSGDKRLPMLRQRSTRSKRYCLHSRRSGFTVQ
jgi:hypothetical protein